MEQKITIEDALNHYDFGYYTSHDADTHEIININEECGVCGGYVESRNKFIAPYRCDKCNLNGY